MDPQQLFVVSTLSRHTIANEVGVEPTDPRLTDEFCQRVANETYEVESLFTGSEAAIEEMYESFSHELS